MKLHSRSFLAGVIAGVSAVAVTGTGFASCKQDKQDKRKLIEKEIEKKDDTPAPALPPQTPDELNQTLAKVDDVVITVGEFQERINKQSPYIRARYTSLEQKREFLDNLIRFEILAKEAFARGFDKNPEVVRTMKQVMIQKLMKDEFENKLAPDSISDDEMRAYYKRHEADYNKPAEVRVSAIILTSAGRAKSVAKEALGQAGSTNKGFRELVNKYSQDKATKIRGGDLRYFNRDTTEVPKAVVNAAFDLKQTGDVAGPISSGGKQYVIKLTGKRKPISKSFDSVKRQIQNRVYREKRTKAQKTFISGLKAKANITINERNLKKVRIDTSSGKKRGRHGR